MLYCSTKLDHAELVSVSMESDKGMLRMSMLCSDASCQVRYIFMLNCFEFESSFPIELELKYVQIRFRRRDREGS